MDRCSGVVLLGVAIGLIMWWTPWGALVEIKMFFPKEVNTHAYFITLICGVVECNKIMLTSISIDQWLD